MEVTISHEDLIDLLESHFKNVYEHIKEGDRITNVEVQRREIVIAIGDED